MCRVPETPTLLCSWASGLPFAIMTPQPPIGTVQAEAWEDGSPSRIVSWPEAAVGDDVRVWVTGEQYRTGDVVRSVSLWANIPELSAADARRVAAALLNAADELDTPW